MGNKRHDQFVTMLNEGLRPHESRLEAKHVKQLARQWPDWVGRQTGGEAPERLLVAHFLVSRIEALVTSITELRDGQSRFSRRHAIAITPGERRRIIIDYARELGGSARTLRGDERAFGRWFGPDAVQDRARVQISQAERMLSFVLQSLGRIAARHLADAVDATDEQTAWKALALENSVQILLKWDGDARVRRDAFGCLSNALQAMTPELASHAIADTSVAYIWRAALDRRLDVWIQREALLLLSVIAFDQLADVLRNRLAEPAAGDDLFVRRYAVELLGNCIKREPGLEELLSTTTRDPSSFVRQAVAHALAQASDHTVSSCWPVLGLDDAIVQVRAAALLQLPGLLRNTAMVALARDWMIAAFERETTVFGLRVALKAAEDAALLSGEWNHEWLAAVLPCIDRLHVECEHLMVRRWAAQTRERLLCHADPVRRDIAERMTPPVRGTRPGRSWRTADFQQDADQLGRALSCVVQHDHGLALEQTGSGSWRMWRGHRFGFRLWRLLHEWRHPSPDKRQAFDHTIGRLFRGTVRVPSGILGELAQTKVPGEPLHMASEAGWRPYLPLVCPRACSAAPGAPA